MPPKPNYYFCCCEHLERHYAAAGNDYRGYRRSSDERYDRGFWDGARARPSAEVEIPSHIWKALAVLVHPNRWESAPVGMKELSHEAMVWLLDHRPSDPERN